MGFPKLFGKKDESKIDYERALRTVAVQEDTQNNSGAQEYTELIARAGFLIHDQVATEILLKNKALQFFIWSLSPTNSVINLDEFQAELKRIRWDNLILIAKLTMDPEVYENGGMEALGSIRMYGHDRINGAKNGWIGHISTEITKRHVFNEEKRSK